MVRIPSEYQEVEYLESTGTQYIDTGIVIDKNDASRNCKIIVDSMNTSLRVGSSNILIAYGYTAGTWFGVSTNSKLTLGGGADFSTSPFIRTTKTIVYDATGITASINDETKTRGGGAATNSIYLFGFRVDYQSKARIFSVSIYASDALIQNLIPCYRKSDNEPGMYDTVSKTFFTNSGTGTFLVGNDVNYSNTNLLEVRRRILLNTPHIESVSGNPAIFTTDMAANLKECKIRFTPVQAGEGTPSPENVRPISGWDGVTVTRCGKNLFNNATPYRAIAGKFGNKIVSQTELEAGLNAGQMIFYGLGYSSGEDSLSYSFNNQCWVIVSIKPNTTYTVNGYWKVGYFLNSNFEKVSGGNMIKASSIRIITPNDSSVCYLAFYCHNYAQTLSQNPWTIDELLDNLQIELGTEATPYEPYVEPQTIAIPFPQTIFGGYVDLIKGEVVEEYVIREMNKFSAIDKSSSSTPPWDHIFSIRNWVTGFGYDAGSPPDILCDCLERVNKTPNTNGTQNAGYIYDDTISTVEEFREKYSGHFVTYRIKNELQTAYSLTSQTIKALKGLNNLYSDANGNIEIKFWKH